MKMVMQLNSMLARDLEVRAGEVRVSKFGLVERIEGSATQYAPVTRES